MAQVIVKNTELSKDGFTQYLVFDYFGNDRRLALTPKVKEYHEIGGDIPINTKIQVTRILKKNPNNVIMEFFRLDKVYMENE